MIDSGFQDVVGVAKRLLMRSGFASIRALDVRLTNEHLELFGEVESFYLKQLAQETIRSVSRSFEIVNTVEVRSIGETETNDVIADDDSAEGLHEVEFQDVS